MQRLTETATNAIGASLPVTHTTPTMTAHVRELYLNLLRETLTNTIYRDIPTYLFLDNVGVDIRPQFYLHKVRQLGRDIPSQAHTAIGHRRLDNVRMCIEQVLADDIPGDLIETGIWRGGALIFMRGVLASYGVTDRRIWGADSFQGLPVTNAEDYPIDHPIWSQIDLELAVSMEEVIENFRRYDLWDEDLVRFLPGWFRDTLPTAPIKQLALLRLDGDLYSSTMEALTYLYPRLSSGGYVIIDDYNLPTCQRAVDQFREEHKIDAPLMQIDGWGVYWRRV